MTRVRSIDGDAMSARRHVGGGGARRGVRSGFRPGVLALVVLMGAVGLGACDSGGSKDAGPKRSTTTSSTVAFGSSSTTPPPTVEGRTRWRDVTARWKALAPAPFAEGRQQVAEHLAALRRGEDTSEVGIVTVVAVQRGEPLVVVLTETGVPDDRVVQIDTEITLEGGDEGWVVAKAREQSACRRGLDATGRACI